MIKIPEDAVVVQDSRLTLIRTITTLYDKLIDARDGLKSKVRATMVAKEATHAQSDLVVAALRPGTPRSTIDARKLYKLVEDGQLTPKQFLSAVTIRKEPLKEFLSGTEIDRLSVEGDAPEPSLVTEFREGVSIDVDELASVLASAIEQIAATSR